MVVMIVQLLLNLISEICFASGSSLRRRAMSIRAAKIGAGASLATWSRIICTRASENISSGCTGSSFLLIGCLLLLVVVSYGFLCYRKSHLQHVLQVFVQFAVVAVEHADACLCRDLPAAFCHRLPIGCEIELGGLVDLRAFCLHWFSFE